MNYYVYKHTNKLNQLFYVGKGCGRRAWKKCQRSDIWNEMSSEGYEVSIIKEFNTAAEALALETKLIKLYKSYGFCGANIKNGGSQYIINDYIRNKMSISAKNRGANNKGCVRTQEHKDAVSRAQTGNTNKLDTKSSQEAIEKMKASKRKLQPFFKAFNKDGKEVYYGNSQTECAIILFNNKKKQTKISDCLSFIKRNIRRTYKGHTFAYTIQGVK